MKSVFPVIMADAPSAHDRKLLEDDLRNPNAIWLAHVDSEEQFRGVNARLDGIAAKYGLQRKLIRMYNDLHGHPTFQSFRFINVPQV